MSRPRKCSVVCRPGVGSPVQVIDTGRRWQGYVVPYLDDDAMAEIVDQVAEGAWGITIWQEAGGGWCYKMADDDEVVELPRRRTSIDGEPFDLTDVAPMNWCWTVEEPPKQKTRRTKR